MSRVGGKSVERVVTMWRGWYLCGEHGNYVERVVTMRRVVTIWRGWQLCGEGGNYVERVVTMWRGW